MLCCCCVDRSEKNQESDAPPRPSQNRRRDNNASRAMNGPRRVESARTTISSRSEVHSNPGFRLFHVVVYGPYFATLHEVDRSADRSRRGMVCDSRGSSVFYHETCYAPHVVSFHLCYDASIATEHLLDIRDRSQRSRKSTRSCYLYTPVRHQQPNRPVSTDNTLSLYDICG